VPKPLIEGLLGGIYLRFLVTREPLDDGFLVRLADWLVGRPEQEDEQDMSMKTMAATSATIASTIAVR
jgi:hypothetical protein